MLPVPPMTPAPVVLPMSEFVALKLPLLEMSGVGTGDVAGDDRVEQGHGSLVVDAANGLRNQQYLSATSELTR